MLTKEECEKALMNICSSNAKMEDRKVFYQLINEHFDNPPLKFEELKEGMWVWDSKFKSYYKVKCTNVCEYLYTSVEFADSTEDVFEENRFYRKQVM